MAQASLVELQNQFVISRDVGYFLDNEFKIIANQSATTNKLLSGLMRSTKDKKFES